MIEYKDSNWGCHISSVIAKMIALADEKAQTVHCEFNGSPLYASPGTTPEVVLDGWTADCDRKAKEYRESPEGRAAARRRIREIERKQFEVDHLDKLLFYTDEDLESVITWMRRYVEVADHVALSHPTSHILSWFSTRGYYPGVNTGNAFDKNDRENVGRYLIGQALDGIRSAGCPHLIFLDWSKKWLNRETI